MVDLSLHGWSWVVAYVAIVPLAFVYYYASARQRENRNQRFVGRPVSRREDAVCSMLLAVFWLPGLVLEAVSSLADRIYSMFWRSA